MESKRVASALELKASDGDTGEFSATFATLGVLDLDDDITVPGAFKNGADVLIGAYQHQMGRLPVGKGVIHADNSRAWVEGQFFLDTTPGLDTFKTVKSAGKLMEWSYIYNVEAADWGEQTVDGRPRIVRYLKAVDVFSVDPVLRGAGIGTGTESIKSSFVVQADAALAAVSDLLTRSKSLADLRAKDGRGLAVANLERLGELRKSLQAIGVSLDELLEQSAPAEPVDLSRERLRFEKALAGLAGVL